MKNDMCYWWYKVEKGLTVISQSENKDFDHTPDNQYVLWIEKSGPHGWIITPDIYDDPIYHYQFFNKDKKPIDNFHIQNNWYLTGISTIDRFRESCYTQFHIRDPKNVIKTYKIWADVSRNLTTELCFVRDEISLFESWEAYEKGKC
jgi:hypothetical protein